MTRTVLKSTQGLRKVRFRMYPVKNIGCKKGGFEGRTSARFGLDDLKVLVKQM